MERQFRRFGWLLMFVVGALSGCAKSALTQKPQSDPLLVTKPAVEGRTHATAHASPMHRLQPTPPPAPTDADSPTSVRRDAPLPIRPVAWPTPLPD